MAAIEDTKFDPDAEEPPAEEQKSDSAAAEESKE